MIIIHENYIQTCLDRRGRRLVICGFTIVCFYPICWWCSICLIAPTTIGVVFGRTWWATGHDVLNLLGIDGLPLAQGLCHRLHLVTVFLDEIARNGVLLINDAANLTVNLLHGVLRQGIAFANTTTQEDFVIIISVHHGP